MKLTAGLLLILFFCSCSKTETPQRLPVINEVSGKLKQVISAMPGSKTAIITTYDYDNTGRVVNYKVWTNDSTMNPMIISSDYFRFTYNGNDPKPISSTHTNHSGSINEITYYTYDLQSRVIREENFRNAVLMGTNTYNYLSNAFTRVTSNGNPITPRTKDTVWTDGSRNITMMKTYSIINPSAPPLSAVLSYDTKKNPVGETNIGIYVKTLFVEDNTKFYFTPNNLLSLNGDIDGLPFTTSVHYNYSTNGFPLKATLSNNLTSVFEYE